MSPQDKLALTVYAVNVIGTFINLLSHVVGYVNGEDDEVMPAYLVLIGWFALIVLMGVIGWAIGD